MRGVKTNMTKRMLFSFSVIAAAAVVAVGATTAFFNDTETSTGNIFTAVAIDLTVDSLGAFRNGVGIPAAPWESTNLTSEKFFDFDDVKPGDWFRRSISLHVEDNPAWACLLVRNPQDDENGLTDPEHEAGDDTPEIGELSQNLHALGWFDSNPNGKLDSTEQTFIDSFFDVFTEIALHDSTTRNGALEPEIPIELLQLNLCAGTSVVLRDGTVTCDGSSMDDQSQTDELRADLQLYVEQVRNNPDFECSNLGERLPD